MNNKLFALGNDIVSINRQIDDLMGCGYVSIPMLTIMREILSVVNEMRIQCCISNPDEKKTENFEIKIICNSKDLSQIVEFIDKTSLIYEIKDI